jgi:hypothetical protein
MRTLRRVVLFVGLVSALGLCAGLLWNADRVGGEQEPAAERSIEVGAASASTIESTTPLAAGRQEAPVSSATSAPTRLVGRVTTLEGAPIAQAEVFAAAPLPEERWGPEGSWASSWCFVAPEARPAEEFLGRAWTDPLGGFVLEVPAGIALHVSARVGGWLGAELHVPPTSAGSLELEAPLLPQVLQSLSEFEVAGEEMRLTFAPSSDGWIRFAFADESRSYYSNLAQWLVDGPGLTLAPLAGEVERLKAD